MAWVVETLKTGRLGQNPSLIDLKGELGVLYAGPLQDSLFFAHRMNSVWVHYQVVKSSRGIISSIDADDNASGLAYVVFIDRPTNPGDPTAISSVVFGQYDGQRWDTEIVAEDGFAQRFFHNVKIAQFPLSLVVGWVQRTSSPELSLVISERKVTGWTESHVSGAVDINANWDLTRVGGALALVYFHRPTKELRYAKFDNGLWVTEAILTIEGDMSLTGLSLTDVDGLPGISYQLSFPNDALPGDQRYVTKNVDGVWDQSNVERPIVSSGFVNNATSIHHLTLPTIAYHIRRPDKMNFAMLIEDKEYDVFLWVIEEVGTNMAMPSHKHIGSVAYIAAYGTKAQSLLIAERV